MNAQHTPGPWRVRIGGNLANSIEADSGKRLALGGIKDDGYRSLATFQTCCASERYDDQEANAAANGRLIAAAPELLEALSYLVALLPDPELDIDSVRREYVMKAITAIAKATTSPPA